MLTLHVEAASYDQLVKSAWAALGLQLKGDKPIPAEPAAEPNGSVEKKPVGRHKKETVDVAPSAPVPTPAAEDPFSVTAPLPTAKITLEQVRTALQAYATKTQGSGKADLGILKAREMLAQFHSVKGTPCQKIAEVQDTDYPAILAKCAA